MQNQVILRSVAELEAPPDEHRAFVSYLQRLLNRRELGHLRYERQGDGRPSKRLRYMTRIEMEFAKYRETGNYENLLNIATYCYLESRAPQHPKFHFDDAVGSATRGIIEKRK